MSSAKKPDRQSTDEYLSMEEHALTKSEYVDGWIRAMSGASVRHNQVKSNCMIHLGGQLRYQACRPYDSDMKVRIVNQGKSRFYYPDLQVVCDSNSASSVFQDRPVLIVEVLSPSTRRYDLDEKMAAYLTIPSLECYILLEQHQPVAIVLRRVGSEFLRALVEGLHSIIDLPFLGCRLAMREIYYGIEFTADCVQEDESELDASQHSLLDNGI